MATMREIVMEEKAREVTCPTCRAIARHPCRDVSKAAFVQAPTHAARFKAAGVDPNAARPFVDPGKFHHDDR